MSSRKLLARAARESNNSCIYITRTAKTPERQTYVMFKNLKRSVAEQRATYKAQGQSVIDVYVEMKAKQCTSEVIKQAIVAKIYELGP